LVSPLQIRELFHDVPPGWRRRLEEERGRGGKDAASAMVDAGTSRVLMGGFGNRPSDLEGYVVLGFRVSGFGFRKQSERSGRLCGSRY
jgi:hypothetical protein